MKLVDLIKKSVARWTAPRPDPGVQESGIDPGAERREAEQWFGVGVQHHQSGRLAEAVAALERAVELRHDHADAQFLLGVSYQKLGRMEDAADCLLLAVCFKRDLPDAHFLLGSIAVSQGKMSEAARHFRTTVEIAPGHADACNALGAALVDAAELEEAAAWFNRALELNPDHARAHSNLGCLFITRLDRFDEGAAHIEAAWRLAPGDLDVQVNWAMLLQHRGRLAESLELWNRLIERGANSDDARLNRALVFLKQGDFDRGWVDYEARKRASKELVARKFPFPEWTGESLAGQTVLVHAEQGLGDLIMFASCIPDLEARAGHCVVEAGKKLAPIFRRSFPSVTVVADVGSATAADASGVSIPSIDRCVAVGSLPLHFRKSAQQFPEHHGYLLADPVKVSRWQDRLAELPGRCKIGISWRGGMRQTRQSVRSLPLAEWLPILRCGDASFVSLQYTDCRAEIDELMRNHSVPVHHWQEAIDDYDETAALVSALDLVVSVQTAIVHLGGALGRPTWVMVPAIAEWRYLQNGERMPWYPSVRIWRQSRPGEWRPLIEGMARELAQYVRDRESR